MAGLNFFSDQLTTKTHAILARNMAAMHMRIALIQESWLLNNVFKGLSRYVDI